MIDKGPNPTVTLTAKQLATQFAADPDATRAKFEGKYLLVTGEVTARETDPKAQSLLIKLKGTDKVPVVFGFPAAFSEQADDEVQVGTKVKALCKYPQYSSKERLVLTDARVIYEPQ